MPPPALIGSDPSIGDSLLPAAVHSIVDPATSTWGDPVRNMPLCWGDPSAVDLPITQHPADDPPSVPVVSSGDTSLLVRQKPMFTPPKLVRHVSFTEPPDRTLRDRDDVMLRPDIFRDARKRLHFKPSIDLFATAQHHQ